MDMWVSAVRDTVACWCTTRVYGFSLDSNRTTLSPHGPGADGECTTASLSLRRRVLDGDLGKEDLELI